MWFYLSHPELLIISIRSANLRHRPLSDCQHGTKTFQPFRTDPLIETIGGRSQHWGIRTHAEIPPLRCLLSNRCVRGETDGWSDILCCFRNMSLYVVYCIMNTNWFRHTAVVAKTCSTDDRGNVGLFHEQEYQPYRGGLNWLTELALFFQHNYHSAISPGLPLFKLNPPNIR